MSTLLCLMITTFIITPCLSQTDASSFAITTSSFSDSGTNAIVILSLSWNTRQYQCIINASSTNGIQPDSSYGCSLYKSPYATLITDSLPTSQYLMKIELQGNNSNSIRFAGIRVMDEDSNYYDINSFCLPSQFKYTSVASINIQSLQCCYWSQRQKYFDFTMGNKETAALIISYIQFRDDVLNHKNQAHEGAVKPPKITTLGIKTLSTSTAGSSSGFNIKLHWDTDEYNWNNLIPKNGHTTYQTSFSSVDTPCEFLTGFNLQISPADGSEIFDDIGIDTIYVIDESNYAYTIETFCMSESISTASKYSAMDICTMDTVDIIRDTYSYDGFIYNTNGSVYFMWDNSLFMHINEGQQAFVIHDYIILGWLYSSTCSDSISPYSKVTIAKDSMSNAANTGWIFSGHHRATISGAVNCPSGALNPCARIAGGGSMVYTLDISDYINIIVQYEMRLSSMPVGKSCYLYYAFDSGAFIEGQHRISTSTEAILYHNESFSVPDHLVNGYTSLKLRFYNDATADTDYCWFDNFYVFGDYLIEYDNCNDSNGWLLHATSFSTDINCPNSACLPLITNDAYGNKTYANIQYYSNIALTVDIQIDSQLAVYYSYDSEQPQILSPISASGTKQIFNIPDADICTSILYIKFMTVSNIKSYVDNIKLSGIILKTLNPTVSPTPYPSYAPTIPTIQPTLYPTIEPTIPTTEPTTEPTIYIPTENSKVKNEKDNSSSMTVTLVVIFIVVVVFIVLFMTGWWYYKRRKMNIPGADLDKPLLDKDIIDINLNKGYVKSVIELNAHEKYDMNNIGHPIPGVGIHGEMGEYGTHNNESNSDSEDGLAQQLQEHLEKDSDATASVMGDQFISDEMKEAEIIGVINETPQ